MFKENRYTTIYFKIIERAKNRLLENYCEEHHIIPKCLGGLDEKSNLVCLTAREHFVCHLLLTKMHDSHKLKFAVVMMGLSNKKHKRYKVNSHQYQIIKQLNSEASSERNKNTEYKTGFKVCYDEISMKESRVYDGVLPAGSVWGRSPKARENVGKANSKKIYYNNPETGVVIAIAEGDSIPEGYIRGNPRANTSDVSGIRGSKYYHCPKTGAEGRFIECPDGWVSGRAVKWATNGTENKQFNINEKLPYGWSYGRNNWR